MEGFPLLDVSSTLTKMESESCTVGSVCFEDVKKEYNIFSLLKINALSPTVSTMETIYQHLTYKQLIQSEKSRNMDRSTDSGGNTYSLHIDWMMYHGIVDPVLQTNHLGIANVRSRIQLLYGNKSGVFFSHSPQGGVSSVVYLTGKPVFYTKKPKFLKAENNERNYTG